MSCNKHIILWFTDLDTVLTYLCQMDGYERNRKDNLFRCLSLRSLLFAKRFNCATDFFTKRCYQKRSLNFSVIFYIFTQQQILLNFVDFWLFQIKKEQYFFALKEPYIFFGTILNKVDL